MASACGVGVGDAHRLSEPLECAELPARQPVGVGRGREQEEAVGAVAVLFLFVVMMLDVDFAALKAEMARYMPLALLIGVILLMQFGLAYGSWETSAMAEANRLAVAPEGQNTQGLGLLIYDQYFLIFQLAGLILLVAMIGAIVLTLRHRTDIKRQNVLEQMWRDPAQAMELKDVKPGQGL
ncbi:MAG: NADH-quinone oxidoreductase subunit J [Pseudomonadota bacterium]|nr:NADH-quinone oxidoreductase subunit J [Pseudomonadota bacterium]